MMNLNLSPVNIDVSVESLSIKKEAFYSLCFITENDLAPRTLEVKLLDDLLNNHYPRFSLAYNFCLTVFMQQGLDSVFVRAKRSWESYEDCFDSDDNSEYYYVVIDSKDINTILNFNSHINGADSYKLQFFSSRDDVSNLVMNRKIVYYYTPFSTPLDTSKDSYYINLSYNNNTMKWLSDGVQDYWDFDGDGNVLYDDKSNVLLQYHDFTMEEAQVAKSAYPEAGWIGRCGHMFPSKIQWLHKFIANVDAYRLGNTPNLSTTSVNILNSRSTEGSGLTGQGVVINEQVSLDWVRYAISKNIWNLLYQTLKINATPNGGTLIENKIKEVLDVAVTEGIFSEYKITESNVYSRNNNASFKFNAKLTYSILNCDVTGTVYN